MLVSAALFAISIFLAIPQMLASTVVALLDSGDESSQTSGPANAVIEKAVTLLFALLLAVIDMRPQSGRLVGLNLRPIGRNLGVGILGAIVLNIVVEIFTRASGAPDDTGEFLKQIGFGASTTNAVLAIAAIAVLGPVAEEFLFRAFLYRSLRESVWRFGHPIAVGIAGVLSAMAFAAIHGDPSQVAMYPMYIVYGILTVVAYELTGSLMAPVLMHASSNAWAMWSGGGDAITPLTTCLLILSPAVALAVTSASGFVLDVLGGDRKRRS